VTLFTDLDAFFIDHRDCGELDGGIDEANIWWRASAAPRWSVVSCRTMSDLDLRR
jgi:hypothetical protein